MKYRTLADFWDTQKSTRQGQCYGLVVLGLFLGLLGALKTPNLTFAQRAGYGLVGGVGLGVLLILVMIVPSIYLRFIERRKKAGKSVLMHRVFLVLYFFPFLTFATLGSAALLLTFFWQ